MATPAKKCQITFCINSSEGYQMMKIKRSYEKEDIALLAIAILQGVPLMNPNLTIINYITSDKRNWPISDFKKIF